MAVVLSPGPLRAPTGALTVDWSNRLSKGLLGAWVFGANGAVDVSGQAPTLTYASAGGAYDQTAEGAGFKSIAANTVLTATATPAFKVGGSGTLQASLYWRAYIVGTPSANTDFIGVTYDNASNPPFNLYSFGVDATGLACGLVYNNVGGNAQGAVGHSVTVGTIESLCATFKGTTNLFYSKGVQTGSVASTFNPNSTATSLIEINTYGGITTRFSNSITLCSYFWNRTLSADEVAWLDLNPYGFFVPAESELTILQAQAGGGGAVKFRRTLSNLGTRAGSRQAA